MQAPYHCKATSVRFYQCVYANQFVDNPSKYVVGFHQDGHDFEVDAGTIGNEMRSAGLFQQRTDLHEGLSTITRVLIVGERM